jgi:hypothetical protein
MYVRDVSDEDGDVRFPSGLVSMAPAGFTRQFARAGAAEPGPTNHSS